MACDDNSGRKCFTVIWKIENVNYWQLCEFLRSPAFTVDEVNKTNWELRFNFYLDRDCESELQLQRKLVKNGAGDVEIDCELAFLSSDGTVLHSFEKKNSVIGKVGWIEADDFPSWNEVFFARRSEFLSEDTLTVRCRIWKSVGEISKDVQCFARTRVAVDKRSFQWSIENFSTLKTEEKETHEITSLETGGQFMLLELSITRGQIYDETIQLKIIPNYENIKMAALKLSIVDASKNIVECFQSEFWVDSTSGNKDFTLFHSKRELMENKREYLPNDVLSLLCECSFSFGTVVKEIEGATSNCSGIENLESNCRCLDKVNELAVPKGVLINDLKSMLNNSSLSDVKLKTRTKTYPAHKFILGVRSPVFKAMFSNDMREKMNDCVNIEDLSDDTVSQMLRHIYCDDVEDLEWSRATELYEAADEYEILDLRDICSSYLKSNLCPSNACKALVLADLHQDEDLKAFVQDFVLRHGKDIINSEEWDQLMENNLKLAAETLRRKYKELSK